MNFTKEEIKEMEEALEARISSLNRIVNGADIKTTETTDSESARTHIETIHTIKNKLENAHVIYLWRAASDT